MLLSKQQMDNYKDYCIIPLFADKPFNPHNAVVVTTAQRMYILGKWRKTHNVEEYLDDVRLLLGDLIQTVNNP
jgi:hypothetical protein